MISRHITNVFAISHKQLKDILTDVVPALHENAKLWVAYPKVASKIVSDLTRDCNWECISQCGFEGVRLITLDNIWSAMRFKRAVKLSVADRYYKMQEKGIVQPVHSKNIKVRKK